MKDLTSNHDVIKELPETEDFFYGIGTILGRLIFNRRRQVSLTQKELAEKAGVGLKTITRAEGGTGNLGVHTYEKIFRALGVSPREYAEMFQQMACSDRGTDGAEDI
ncbi:helix-turn-helix domain-containing protein [Salimicrobium flavidum]|uniref:Helix-turn-helix domain-containing protein n=1 Tax=Salimicrobium flavidum TaxID=570947 RepID=A0A1N7JFU9_9BACI|nr:helix-turn-helix transcriptional regulator [Salimicrobium flavidum]SIS48207.1 Helix-turn-helix domain-containing protein [Salimicrobium flavidum]